MMMMMFVRFFVSLEGRDRQRKTREKINRRCQILLLLLLLGLLTHLYSAIELEATEALVVAQLAAAHL